MYFHIHLFALSAVLISVAPCLAEQSTSSIGEHLAQDACIDVTTTADHTASFVTREISFSGTTDLIPIGCDRKGAGLRPPHSKRDCTGRPAFKGPRGPRDLLDSSESTTLIEREPSMNGDGRITQEDVDWCNKHPDLCRAPVRPPRKGPHGPSAGSPRSTLPNRRAECSGLCLCGCGRKAPAPNTQCPCGCKLNTQSCNSVSSAEKATIEERRVPVGVTTGPLKPQYIDDAVHERTMHKKRMVTSRGLYTYNPNKKSASTGAGSVAAPNMMMTVAVAGLLGLVYLTYGIELPDAPEVYIELEEPLDVMGDDEDD